MFKKYNLIFKKIIVYNMSEYRYTLLKSLYYSIKENELQNDNIISVNTKYKFGTINEYSCKSLNSSYEDGFQPLDGKLFNISYTSIRVPKTNLNTTVISTYKEFININTPEGSIAGSTVYNDERTGSTTTVNKTTWAINGIGNFIEANYMEIIYDNNGFISGYPYSRQMNIYKVETI